MTTTAAERARDDRAAVDKAISLLVSFGAQASTGLGVSELARRSGLSKSTAFRVLGLLERNGVVERIDRDYRLGERLHDLGRHVYPAAHDRTRDLLTPHLIELYERTKATVHLGVLHGTDMLVLAKLYGHRHVSYPTRVGGRLPAYCTASGKAFLAHDPDGLDRVLAAPMPALTPKTITDPSLLAAQISRVRREGVATTIDEVVVGKSSIAMPVLAPGGTPVATLSVSGPTGRMDLRAQTAALRQVCATARQTIARAAAERSPRAIA